MIDPVVNVSRILDGLIISAHTFMPFPLVIAILFVRIIAPILVTKRSLFSVSVFLLKLKFVAITESIPMMVMTIISSARVNHFREKVEFFL